MNSKGLTAGLMAIGLTLGVSGDEIIVRPRSETVAVSDRPGAAFMRAKLDAVNQIVEGLSVEDHSLIAAGGEKLLTLSADAAFQVRRDPLYMHYSSTFQTTVNDLVNAAKKESLGDATINYINLTVSCVACHKHVRGTVQMAPLQNAGDGPILR